MDCLSDESDIVFDDEAAEQKRRYIREAKGLPSPSLHSMD